MTPARDVRPKRVCAIRFSVVSFLLPPVRQFLDGLSDQGYEVHLVKTYPRSQTAEEESRPKLRNHMLALYFRKLPKSRWVQPFIFVEFVVRGIFTALVTRPHLVIAIDVDTLLQGYVVSRLCRVPLLFYSIELYTERPGVKPKWFWVGLERMLINKAQLVVACEPNRSQVLHDKYGARPMPMTVLNVPPFELTERTDRIPRYLEQRGIRARRIAFYVGMITRARCIENFVEAAKHLDDGIVVFLLGPVEEGFEVDRLIDEHGVKDRVVLHPAVQPAEVRAFTCSADLGLQVQFNQGLNSYYCAPIKLFEYLMCGLPIVASNFPGMLEVVEGNEVGLCVDPQNAQAIAQAINRIAADDDCYERMSRNARRVAREVYCYEVQSKKLFEAVEKLMQERGQMQKAEA